MATLRMGSGLPSRPDEPIRARRAAASTESREDPRLPQRIRREGENIRIAIQQPTQTQTQIKPPNRGPQNAHARRPSIPVPPNRPPLTHQTQSWSSNSTASERPNHIPSLSASSTSGRSQAGTPKSRNVLRRKQSSIAQKTPSLRHDSQTDSRTSSSSSAPRSRSSLDPAAGMQLDRGFTESPTEIRIAHVVDLPKTQAQTVTIYPELDRYRDFTGRPSTSSEGSSVDFLHRLATHDLPPPTPVFSGTSSQLSAFSGSPSTRFSESPGPGPYSRDTTPTSISSQSPGLMAHLPVPRTRQLSPALTRPPVTRRRAGSTNEMDAFSADPQGLAAVRESLTSSSSNSTVREVERKGSKKKKRLSPLPPSPPPRKSSQKFTKIRDDEDSPSKSTKEPVQPTMAPPSPMQSPPRLAPSASPRQTPPMRPSRENTPDLQSQLFGPLPIIHSNLSSTSLSNDRPLVGSRSVTPSAYPEKPQTSRLPVGREATPAPRPVNPPDANKKTDGRATRTPSPNTSTFSRFPFFGRRSKTAPEVPQVDKKDKSTRKGPAAGTGHEGYGRLGAIRRRSGSSTTNLNRANPGPASSQDSLSSSQPIDTFLLERMNPVIISGGEVVENRNNSVDLPRTESNQSLGYVSDVSTTSSTGRLGLAPSAIPRGPPVSLSHRRPSDSSDSEAVTMKSTLAFRRSVQRLRSSPDQSPLKLPKPIDTAGITAPSMDSLDTTILSDDSQFEKHREVIRGRIAAATASPPKKLTKRARSPRKWNLFSRSQSQPNKKKQSEAVPVTATVTVVQHKPAAFYTMMDGSEQEDSSPPDVEEILREAVVFDLPSPPPIKERRASTTSQEQRRESLSRLTQPTRSSQARRNSASAKSTSIPAIRSMKPTQNPQANAAKPAETRPSRLPQVGRIPKVVNSRPEHTSSRSFSRPFNRISMQMQPQAAGFNPDFVASGPSPPELSTPELSRGDSTTTGETNSDPRSSIVPVKTPEMIQIGREFLAFSPRKNSECTTSTSSSGGMYTLADALAYVPDPDAPLVEDEIWDEYNDLIGEVPPSATSSKGIPFHLEGHDGRLSKRSLVPLESPTIVPSKVPEKNGPSATSSSVYSADMTERLKAAFALKPENNSMTLVPVAEVPASVIDRESTELARKATVASQRSSNSSRKSRLSRQSDCSCKSSEDESPISQVNLRVGSMTVSKWLSFGHVLFSPARDQLVPVVGSLKRHSILVVDGLGNDDWSFYAAETYPAATFFNLSPRAPLPEEHKNSSSFPLSPPNHHQIQYLSHTAKFPFGPESFTSVVFRFPAAAPESHYRNIVSEARRVLKPGGYLELSILDVDLNNMGNRGRRTIRRLKERIHERNAEISIGSSSDLILRLLGRKGFSDVKTCRVGVPVASVVTRSENGSKPPVSGARKAKEVRSLAEMMNEDGDSADENITKMVAKVGRWWYSRCYESAAGTAASRSIWTDRALLTECEELRTSFKLMVCYARVPERARTASI